MIDSLYAFLAKLGFTDPLHAPITHMPIGLVTGALLFFLVAVIFNRRVLVLTARHVSILAFIFVFPTILLGVLDWMHFFRAALITPIKIKMILAAVVLVVLGAGIILGSEVKVRTAPQLVLYALAFVAVVGLGYYGAKLVYGEWAPRKISAGAPAGEQPAAPAAPAGQEQAFAAGAQLFTANCQSCHPGGGNVIDPKLPLKGAKPLGSLQSFVGFIRAPSMPDGSPGQMPAFGPDAISAQQASDLYVYVTTNRW
jgi:mono/diheme cytochrome c family protein